MGGVAGVLWQARVANAERRRAEARSSDLRQLSNSLLSELDDAIKQLPGSTGVQKLLVTRVLEHLDRMAGDARGDRQTQLDLVDAYTRLGNIQGNPYDQNLGDPAGALLSLGKALAIAEPLAGPGSRDQDALRALALAQASRSEILFGTARTQDAIASMRAAVETYNRLIAPPDAPVSLICDTSSAYGTLGDELGQTGTASLADLAGALAAFRQSIALDDRVLAIDPHVLRAQRGLAISQMKIGSVEMDADPAQALKDFEIALERADALPTPEQSGLPTLRMRAMILRKEANALVQLGEYTRANALFAEVTAISQRLVTADPQDLRALADLEVVLDDEARGFEDAANPILALASGDRRRNLSATEKLLNQVAGIFERMLQQDPSDENWKAVLADVQAVSSAIQSVLHSSGDSGALAQKGLATLREIAQGSGFPHDSRPSRECLPESGSGLAPRPRICHCLRRARGGSEPREKALLAAHPRPGLSGRRSDGEEPLDRPGRIGAAACPAARKHETEHPQAAGKTKRSIADEAWAGRPSCLFEPLHMPQGWKQFHPQERHGDGSQPAQHGGRHGPKQGRGDATLEFAQLIGGVDEQVIHRAHAAAHLVGRAELHQGDADHHAHHIRRAHNGEREKRKPDQAGEGKHHRRQAKDDDRLEHPHADAAVDGVAGQHGGHQQCSHRRRGAQHPQAPGPRMQNVAGIDGHQCRRPAQQDGEQIQRYRSQDCRVVAHEPHAGETRTSVGGSLAVTGRSSRIAPFSIPARSQKTAIIA